MSRYFKRYLHPRPNLVMFLSKLLRNGSGEVDTYGNYIFTLKKTGHKVKVSMHWITESA